MPSLSPVRHVWRLEMLNFQGAIYTIMIPNVDKICKRSNLKDEIRIPVRTQICGIFINGAYCFRNISDGGWSLLTRDFHPLRFPQIALFACDGSHRRSKLRSLRFRLRAKTSYRFVDPPLPTKSADFAGFPIDASTLELRLGKRIIILDMRVIASKPATTCCARNGSSPCSSFLTAGSWPASFHTAVPFGPHTKRIR